MIAFVSNLQNIDLLSVGIAVAGMVILGFAVLYNNLKSLSNRVFFYLAITAGVWGTINYLSYQHYPLDISFWLLRAVMFFAVWSSFFTFAFTYLFPSETTKFPKYFKWIIAPFTTVTAFLCLTNLVFSKVSEVTANGSISRVVNGPGIIVFAIDVAILNLGALILLIRKVIRSRDVQRKSLQIVLLGMFLMLSLIIVFNFILPAFFDNTKFISLGALFLFPFIAFTSYAIMRHKLFNIRVAGTAALVFALAVVTFSEVILARELSLIIYRSAVFILVLIFGTLLIKGVLREVQQREQLQVLTKQLEAANEQLKVLDQARAEFISIASHQLRTPPATVKWYLSAILAGDYGKLEPETKDIIEKTFRTNNSLISLIDDMLNVSRIERGKMEFLFEETDVQQLAQITFEQLQPMALEKHLRLIYNAPAAPLPQIMADKEKLRQVMNNLIDNSLKYTKQGSVTIGLFQEGDNLRFEVSDTGKGISPEEKEQIFEKFTRGKESIKQSTGLGLGLYVAKIVIEQHKGKIWAESAGEGKGSKFIFTIPIHNNLTKTTLLDLTQGQNKPVAK